jgi:hypothetical protein
MDSDQVYKSLISWLVIQRNLSGMTQIDLSIALKKPQSFVSKFENFDRKLTVSEFVIICKSLHCDPTQEIRKMLDAE